MFNYHTLQKRYKKSIFLLLAFLITVQTFAQLSIEDCYEKAMANYPLVRQYDLIEQTRNYSLSNIGKTWLPQIQLSAKASYQSDVTKIPIDFSQVSFPQPIEMKIPELNKDQYGATVEMSQTLWDGGFSSANSKTVKANIDTEKAELDVSLYALKERVNQLFFGILLCDALIEQNRLFQDELQQKFDHINALVKSGLANQADVNAVKAEQLKAKQTFTQIAHNRKANLQMLAAFIGEKLDENISLKKPEITYLLSKEISRPELSLYDSRLVSIDAARNELKAGLMPRIGLFFTVGYGNPGLNMLKNDFSAYYIGGIRLTWNIGNLYTFKNSQNLLNSNRNAVSIQRETFMFNTSLSRSSKENEIDKYREMLKLDDEIISLQSSVKLSVESKLNGGTAGVNDLIHEIIAEELAKQNKILHEIEMLQAIYSLKFIVN